MTFIKIICRVAEMCVFACSLLAQEIISLFEDIKQSIGYVFLGLLYPILVTAIAVVCFDKQINFWLCRVITGVAPPQDKSNLLLVCLGILLLTIAINAIVQFIACLCGHNEDFIAVFKLQKVVNAYTLAILSLAALWVAGVISASDVAAKENLKLLAYGSVYLLSSFFCDTYDHLVMSKRRIENIYEEIANQWTNLKKGDNTDPDDG